MNGFVAMAGVDHSTASLEIRERFAFTKAASQAAMQAALELPGVTGCVILSTCNRTELWLSCTSENGADPAALLCSVRGVQPGAAHVSRRAGRSAACHLLETACGLHSRVFGEDQIVAQVNAALAFSRECGCAGPVLERLFRTAVTAAKRVKTTVRLAARDASAPARAAALLEHEWGALAGCECLIIGNGEMGRLAARELLARGCKVKMTLRSYKRGAVQIPAGCVVVPYEARYTALDTARVVLSATSSPHHTLHYEEALPHLHGERRIFLDLAVPRDISVRLVDVPGVSLYDIDSLGTKGDAPPDRAGAQRIARAHAILEAELETYEAWLSFSPLRPLVAEIGAQAADDVLLRVEKVLATVPEGARTDLEAALRRAVAQTVQKLAYGLRGLPEEAAGESLRRLSQAAQKRPAQYALRAAKKEESFR